MHEFLVHGAPQGKIKEKGLLEHGARGQMHKDFHSTELHRVMHEGRQSMKLHREMHVKGIGSGMGV